MAPKATDIVAVCLNLTPVSALRAAFVVFKLVWEGAQAALPVKQQLTILTEAIAHLLQILDGEYRAEKLSESKSGKELGSLQTYLYDISAFVKAQNSNGLLKIIYHQNDSGHTIRQFHRRLIALGHSFNVTLPDRIHDWQTRQDEAKKQDQETLDKRLTSLEGNRKQLLDTLTNQHTTVVAMMISLQKSLDKQVVALNARHRRFLRHSLTVLETSSPEQDSMPLEDWFITSFEVEYDDPMSSGEFFQVKKGYWNKSPVAIKVLRATDDSTPSLTSVQREVKTWTNLRHQNVLRIFGANAFDAPPFIVMPYLRNGNALNYIQNHPDCDRVKILYHVAQGLKHLHSHGVTHGDLKGLNVLIDDNENGVVCDYGLSRLKVDAKSHSSKGVDPILVLGGWHWMSPERLLGGMLKKPVDVYAFGMVIWELFMCKVPLGHLSYSELCDLVVNNEVRPQRPEPEDAPDLSDYLWNISVKCWRHEAKLRPDAFRIADEMELCYHAPRASEGRQTKRSSGPIQENLDPPPLFGEEPPGHPRSRRRHQSVATTSTSNLSVPNRAQDIEAISLISRTTATSRRTSSISSPSEINEMPSNLHPFPARENRSHARLTPLRPTWAYDPSHSSRAASEVNIASSPTLGPATGSPIDQLPTQVKTLVDFNPPHVDAEELVFKTGEMLEVLDDKGKWWMCRKADGSRGIVLKSHVTPVQKSTVTRSNSFLRLRRPSNWSFGLKRKGSQSASSRETPTPFPITQQSVSAAPPLDTLSISNSPAISTANLSVTQPKFNDQSAVIFQAMAKFNYKSQTSGELSFYKGEILDILDIEMKWWVARKIDGTVGILPYNFVQVIR
ncbi:kinase-like domain-containing protein [Crepidotus variabilis]|uniref:mitogen-activated protein kinase kinase kinase n=1 Tax=Crepidotus variabilis TaxID=179855 RepID=A0A9P6ELC6_9AGAR|nr:kinase-like domain-containing protein [Crepidotus variabilis]